MLPQGSWMDYCLLKVTFCPIYSLLWLILCLAIPIQTEMVTTLLSHKTLSRECSSFNLQHLWSRNILTGTFQWKHRAAGSARCCANRCRPHRALWQVLTVPLAFVLLVGFKTGMHFVLLGLAERHVHVTSSG